MSNEVKDSQKAEELMEDEKVKLSAEEVENIGGGKGAFAKVPRVPVNKIDQNLKDKI